MYKILYKNVQIQRYVCNIKSSNIIKIVFFLRIEWRCIRLSIILHKIFLDRSIIVYVSHFI